MAGDDDGACARALALLDHVALVEALALVRGLELLGELVVADATSVNDRARWEDVLVMVDENGWSPENGRGMNARTAAPRAAFWDAPPAT